MIKKNKQEQIKILKQALKEEKLNKREYTRIQAVYSNLKGLTHKQISEITLKSTDAIEKWITLFNRPVA